MQDINANSDLDAADLPKYQFGMAGNGLKVARKRAKMSQKRLAELVHTGQPQIRRLEAGERKLTKEWAERLAPHLKVRPQDLLFPEGTEPDDTFQDDEPAEITEARRRGEVPIVGFVGAGAEAYFFPAGDLDTAPAPPGSSETTVAVEVRGVSLGDLFDRWLVFYDDVRRPVTTDLVGRLCVVGLSDGRVLVKRIQRGRADGLFSLYSQQGEPILDVAIDWAAKVKNMAPR